METETTFRWETEYPLRNKTDIINDFLSNKLANDYQRVDGEEDSVFINKEGVFSFYKIECLCISDYEHQVKLIWRSPRNWIDVYWDRYFNKKIL